jgi:hypothetical protein
MYHPPIDAQEVRARLQNALAAVAMADYTVVVHDPFATDVRVHLKDRAVARVTRGPRNGLVAAIWGIAPATSVNEDEGLPHDWMIVRLVGELASMRAAEEILAPGMGGMMLGRVESGMVVLHAASRWLVERAETDEERRWQVRLRKLYRWESEWRLGSETLVVFQSGSGYPLLPRLEVVGRMKQVWVEELEPSGCDI